MRGEQMLAELGLACGAGALPDAAGNVTYVTQYPIPEILL
jgi:hypothetical protein